MKMGVRVSLVCLSLLALAACANGPEGPKDSIVVVPGNLVLDVGVAVQLSANVVDGSGQPVGGANVTYSSADTTIVRATLTGMLLAVAGGHTVVHAVAGSLTTDVPVFVHTAAFAKSVTVAPDSATIPLISSAKLIATV